MKLGSLNVPDGCCHMIPFTHLLFSPSSGSELRIPSSLSIFSEHMGTFILAADCDEDQGLAQAHCRYFAVSVLVHSLNSYLPQSYT